MRKKGLISAKEVWGVLREECNLSKHTNISVSQTSIKHVLSNFFIITDSLSRFGIITILKTVKLKLRKL